MNTILALEQEAVVRSLYPTKREKTVESDRYLATVMFIDVVSFTRLMHENEQQAMDKLAQIRQIIEFFHLQHQGRIVQYYGDGCLSTFATVTDALSCALAIQRQTRSDQVLPLRIGIHTGEIVEKDGAIYGDTVNITSRVEAAAQRQTVVLSDTAFRNVSSQSTFSFVDLGEQRFKNIDTPIRLFALEHDDLDLPPACKPSLFERLNQLTTTFLG